MCSSPRPVRTQIAVGVIQLQQVTQAVQALGVGQAEVEQDTVRASDRALRLGHGGRDGQLERRADLVQQPPNQDGVRVVVLHEQHPQYGRRPDRRGRQPTARVEVVDVCVTANRGSCSACHGLPTGPMLSQSRPRYNRKPPALGCRDGAAACTSRCTKSSVTCVGSSWPGRRSRTTQTGRKRDWSTARSGARPVAAGLLGINVDEEYGGGGQADFRFNAVLVEEIIRAHCSGLGFGLHNDVVAPYLTELTTEEQRKRWLPGFCSGDIITAIAMSEPGAGSDLAGVRTTAVRDGDTYVLNGQKTFITNGEHADLVIVVAKTATDQGAHGVSLIVVERGTPGFTRGRRLEKVGLKANDTAELFFDDCRVPADNLIGTENHGFYHLMGEPAPGTA